jgi:hypothetical protein
LEKLQRGEYPWITKIIFTDQGDLEMAKHSQAKVVTEEVLPIQVVPGNEEEINLPTDEDQFSSAEEHQQESSAPEQLTEEQLVAHNLAAEAAERAEDLDKLQEEPHEPRKTVTEFLKCRLTRAEKLQLSEEMSQAVVEKNTAEEELQTVKADFKSRITRAETTIADCARKINSGYEMRNVECEVIKDYRTNSVEYMRLDTYEIFRSRAMKQEERQRSLELVGGSGVH